MIRPLRCILSTPARSSIPASSRSATRIPTHRMPVRQSVAVTTWNINSVRLRIDLVARFLKSVRPDVLCLQETKCPDGQFPLRRLKRLGYPHVAVNGQKGYHGVAIISRLPFAATDRGSFGGKEDARHIAVTLADEAGLRDPIRVDNFYVP